ncbi:MFS general substrate transporter [Trematosphaeria pertusa]|uniref:MFS general substrate transporter n=1 Tax=Trematosphaeria pertusa TaxID=390896 RepID=A0A6A6IWI3_9PLEO|nr:MFS general substrate transporter [Trematosphaeria pertusa]KAF2254809.1 MFS general substrate transporter [Trematosphaeria pertusa]
MRFLSLRDLDQTEGTVQLQKTSTDDNGKTNIVLVPAPSRTDPNDPLRWPRWKKHVAFTSVCAFTFLTNYAIGGLAPAFYILSIEFSQTMTSTSHLLLYPILVLGLFNFFWVPLANYFGKRPVFVFASLLLCLCYVWGAVATSFKSLLWSNIIAAFAGSSTEALGAAIVNDLYYLHERGSKMGIYMNAISGGNTLGPLICGFVVQSLGWRWHKWIAVILTAVNFVAVLLFVPETRYHRDATTPGISNNISASTSEEAVDIEKAVSTGVTAIRRTSDEQIPQVPKKTFAQDLKLWSGTPPTNLFKMFIRPFPMIAYPAVIYSFLCYSISLVIVVAVNILNSFVLQAPPYNWSPQINGLINIPGLLGNLFGAWAGGDLVDMWCAWRTKKNKGIFEPESRLYLLIIPFFLTSAGCVLFGYGVQNTMSWVALFFGYGMISVALTATPTITMAYVSDCALPVNSDALLLVNGLKNVVAFGFLYGVVPWVEEVGYVDCFGTMAGIFVAIVGIGAMLLILYGARVRHATAKWQVILD